MPESLDVIQWLLSFVLIWILLGAVVPWLWGSWVQLYWTWRPWWIGHRSWRDQTSHPWRLLRWSRSADGRALGLLSRADAEARIREYELDHRLTRPAATLSALVGRTAGELLLGFPWSREVRRRHREMAPTRFPAYLRALIDGWHEGTPVRILRRHLDYIERAAPRIDDLYLRHSGLCTVAAIRYLLGEFSQGHKLAEKNWRIAKKLEREANRCGARKPMRYEGVDADQLVWMASYAWFNSTLFLGDFHGALQGLTEHWRKYSDEGRRRVQQGFSDRPNPPIPLDPVTSLPRHVVLAAALMKTEEDQADREEQDGRARVHWYELEAYWPSDQAFHRAARSSRKEVAWLTAWYDLATSLGQERADHERERHRERVSLDFGLSYAGLYYTLLLNDPTLSTDERRRCERSAAAALSADVALSAVATISPTVSRYTLLGFRGIFELVAGRGAKAALRSFREAARYSEVSGNSFFNCLFFSCHARTAAEVAVEGDHQPLESEVDHYLKAARKIARKIARQGGSSFYLDLCRAATLAVYHLRRIREGKARRLATVGTSELGPRLSRVFVPAQAAQQGTGLWTP